jgi:hypothetical protein
LVIESRSGLSVTTPMGDQLRVLPDQRAGWSSRQRMQKVNAAWSKYLVLWGLLGVLGLGLRFATGADFSQGLGIALLLFAGVGLMVDGFAERRAHAYESVLQGSNPRLHQK